jgi:hypothetical protein
MFSGGPYNTQGVYCNDLSYYVFKPNIGNADLFTLYKLHLTGMVKQLVCDEYLQGMDGLVYSRIRNRLYCFKHYSGAGGLNICEISTTDTTFSTTKLKNIPGTSFSSSTVSSTIDDEGGLIYFAVNSSPDYNIIQFSLKDSSVKTLYSGKKASMLGLQFSSTDKTLYAMLNISIPYASKTNFVRITPQGMLTVVVDSLSFNVDTSAYSACLDNCNKQYILSTSVDPANSTLSIFDLNGKLQKHDTLHGIYQGLYMP